MVEIWTLLSYLTFFDFNLCIIINLKPVIFFCSEKAKHIKAQEDVARLGKEYFTRKTVG